MIMILELLKQSELSSKNAYSFLLETFKYARTLNKGVQSDLTPHLILSGYMMQEYELENREDLNLVENAAKEFLEKDLKFNTFADIQAARRTVINQISFQYDKFLLESNSVSDKWLREKIEKHGLKDTQIIKDLQFDKSDFSNYKNGNKKFTPKHKRALFYYFQQFP